MLSTSLNECNSLAAKIIRATRGSKGNLANVLPKGVRLMSSCTAPNSVSTRFR